MIVSFFELLSTIYYLQAVGVYKIHNTLNTQYGVHETNQSINISETLPIGASIDKEPGGIRDDKTRESS